MEEHIAVEGLTMAYGDKLIQQNLNFTVKRGDIFIIMGGSGCGKSTLLKHDRAFAPGGRRSLRRRIFWAGDAPT